MEGLGINGGFLLAQLINFGFIFLALTVLAWRPLIRFLEARRERIAKGLEDARAAEQARADAERNAQKLIDQGRSEAAKIVEEGRSRGEEQAKIVLEDARKEADAIRQKARTDAEEEKTVVLGQVRSQVADLAIAAAERVIGQSLDEKKAQAIVAEFFAKVPEDAKKIGDTLEVISALPLTDAEKKDLEKKTGAKHVSYTVDPSILGGLILRAGDKVIDGSVRTSLTSLAGQMR